MRYAIFKDNPTLRDALVVQLQRFRERVQDFMTEIFTEYRTIKSNYACRIAGAFGQSLHIDAYESSDHFNQVKLFLNVDNCPRLWCTGERTNILVERYYEACKFAEDRNLPYTEFLKRVDEKILEKSKDYI